MKFRQHHNNKGYRKVKTGSYLKALRRIARKLKIKFIG